MPDECVRHILSFPESEGRPLARRPQTPSTTTRGYGAAHQRERAKWKPIVEAGLAVCWRCGKRIGPETVWDLGHDDDDRSQYRGPEHVKCNRATSGRRKRRGVLPNRASRDW